MSAPLWFAAEPLFSFVDVERAAIQSKRLRRDRKRYGAPSGAAPGLLDDPHQRTHRADVCSQDSDARMFVDSEFAANK